jgi:rhodanese-related sulfurtransferase
MTNTQQNANLSQFIRLGINANSLKMHKPFCSLNEKYRKHVIFNSVAIEFKKGDTVFSKQRDASKSMYLLKGKLSCKTGLLSKKVLEAGNEACLFDIDSQIPEGLEAVALEEGHALVVDRELMDTALAWTQTASIEEAKSVGQAPKAEVAEMGVEEEEEGDWMSNLLSFPLFFNLPPANISRAFAQFERVDMQKGDKVITEGEEGDYFYVIIEGKAAVMFSNKENKPILLDTGSYFGEDALISNKPRSASIVMATEGVLGRMDKENFRNLLADPLVKFISEEEVGMKLIKGGKSCMLVDVRTQDEFNHAPSFNAKNIPYNELRNEIPGLPQDGTFFISHEGGKRSELAAHLFAQAGLNAFVITPPAQVPVPASTSTES